MADGRIDPLDVVALERSVNDSAGRVSSIWLSFVAFSAYLAAAASMISHRQMFLEEPIKLPTINIDLPLVASAILLPLLFVVYHIFVLLQVVLLARTADAYNEAIEHGVTEATDRTRVRQRLANTLFAQLFAGSPREREGVLGWLLRAMAWITLAIAPVGVLLVFEIKFLPFHSAAITWTHRLLITCDLAAVLFLWAGAIKPTSDIQWRSLRPHWKITAGAVLIVVACCVLVTFPGEPTRAWVRLVSPIEPWREDSPECRFPPFIDAIVRPGFDRLVLVGEDFVDNDKLDKIIKIATENGQQAHETERTHVFRGRDLRCARFAGTDLGHSEFIAADLSGASLRAAHLEGSTFSGANLTGANLDGARLQGSWFGPYPLADGTTISAARMSHTYLRKAQLQGADLAEIDFEGSSLDGALLATANLWNARLSKATMFGATLAGANLGKAHMQALSLRAVDMRGAILEDAELQRAELDEAILNGANLARAHLEGASLNYAQLQAANLSSAELQGAHLDASKLMGATLELARMETADLGSADLRGAMLGRANLAGADLSNTDLQGATFQDATLSGASLAGARLGLASFENARLQAIVLVNATLPGTFLGGTRLQGAKLANSELAGAILAKTFLWRAYLASAQDCAQAHVSEPILESSWDYGRHTRGGQGTALQEIAPNVIDGFLRDRVDRVSTESREQLRTALKELLAPEPDDALRANMATWQQCADGTSVRSQQSFDQLKADYEGRLATYLLNLMCAEGVDTKYLADGLVTYRIKAATAALAATFARGFVALPEKSCPAAAQIDEKTKVAIRSHLPKKQAG